jgi:hypothetical protein
MWGNFEEVEHETCALYVGRTPTELFMYNHLNLCAGTRTASGSHLCAGTGRVASLCAAV